MHGEPPLPVTPTHSGNEAKGTILGLEGMSIVPVVGGAILTILLLVILIPGATGGLFPQDTDGHVAEMGEHQRAGNRGRRHD